MSTNNMEKSYRVELREYSDKRMSKVRVMICQFDFDRMRYAHESRLYFVSNATTNSNYIRRFLMIARNQHVDLLVFPELSIPEDMVQDLMTMSLQNDMYIIGGTHYKKTPNGFVSVCPIVTPHGLIETEKINPSPYEQSSFMDSQNGAVSGHLVSVLKGTKVGNLAITICLDYTNDELRVDLFKNDLDFLIIPAFNKKSEEFFHSMHSDVQRAPDGLYIIYSNNYSSALGIEGKSSLFAFVDECFKSEFKDQNRTDLNPSNKIYEFATGTSYCIFDLDMAHKKPYGSKNAHTESNVKVLEEDDARTEKRYKFLNSIGVDEDRYKYIDQYYVKPQEYDEMASLLERGNILIIIGDPGIGKTYTAIHFLLEYYQKDYKPIWFYGMEREDREAQKEQLQDFEPEEHQVVYLEDPFGKTIFENREELKSLLFGLCDKFKASGSKLIITSRSEVFKQFNQENLNGGVLVEFMKEMNVRNPSYSKPALVKIARHYIEAYTNWASKKKYVRIITKGIYEGKLFSPLMIYNLVKNYSQVKDIGLLRAAIKNANADFITQFALEIKTISIPAKILLYLVLLYGGRKSLKEPFQKVQDRLSQIQSFDLSTFSFELKEQEGHRIQRIGNKEARYRFSHPTYEEAIVTLSTSDANCALVLDTCLTVLLSDEDFSIAKLFRRYIYRYPVFLENLLNGLSLEGFEKMPIIDRIVLNRRMILSSHLTFREIAKSLYPINTLVQDVYSGGKTNLFTQLLLLLRARREEIAGIPVEWDRVFSKDIISNLHPTDFINCCRIAKTIDKDILRKIETNIQKDDLIKKYILLTSDTKRMQLELLLMETKFSNTYSELKETIPNFVIGDRSNGQGFVRAYKSYVLHKDKPKGCVIFNEGTTSAILHGAKLFPVGVEEVEGDFGVGDIVQITTTKNSICALSIVEMSSEDIRRYKGLGLSEIYDLNDNTFIANVISRKKNRELQKRES